MKKSLTQRALAYSAIAFAAAMTASAAQAVDFDGYFRVGPGGTKKDAARACYNLGVLGGGHYRLGNECDFYGEFGLAQTGTVDGVTYKAKVMFNEYNPGTDIGPSSSSFEQMYVEGKGFDIAPETNFWIGKRFYGRTDVHIMDKFFVNMTGTGAGFETPMGNGAQFALAYFGDDGGPNGLSNRPGKRVNVDVTSIPVNPGGTLRVTGTVTQGDYDNATSGKGTSGFGISLQHNQDIKELGGGNTAWLQYAQGSAGLDGGLGKTTSGSGAKRWLLVESLAFQTGPTGGQLIAMYGQSAKDNTDITSVKFNELSIGGRVSYALTKNFKLVGEAGYMEHKPSGAPTQKLAKFTFAPTLSTGPGFWNRPELRLYVTTAKWNTPANVANGAGGLTGLGDNKTNGTSYGFQAEVWF